MNPKLILSLTLILGGGMLFGCCTASNSRGRISDKQPDCIRLSGEFKKPGGIPWTNGMTLKDAITIGELTDFARHQILISHADGTRDQYRWSPQE